VDALRCQFCGCELDEYFVNPAGELVGCESCAEQRGLAGEVLPQEEWNTPAVVAEVLEQFGVADAEVRKPTPTPTQQPRTHYFEVLAPDGHYYLRRFYSWYPTTAIRYMHSVAEHLLRSVPAIPVPQHVAAPGGLSYVEAGGTAWALYRALEGRGATAQEWMWCRPKAADLLAQMHVALESFTPDGEPFRPWGAWTLDTLDRVLDSWNPHPDLTPELLAHIRDRLAVRYFGELYPALPKLIVHGDYVAANVLWRGDAMNAQVSGVLDFEKAHLDTALFDFAWGLGDRRPPLVRATLAAYTRVRPLSILEREALPESLLLGALMGIDMQMTYYNNLEEVARQAQELQYLVRDIESIRKVAAPK
jgi:Ser/Thr protein kinase RdoA (MazF antagonist)